MSDDDDIPELTVPAGPLKRGWTTGACATAATRAAYELLMTGNAPAVVEIGLPGGARVSFAVAMSERRGATATAGVVKDAGDDPDVTHGALVKVSVSRGQAGTGVIFQAGEGVGTVTRPGLPIPPGEPAINPVPREMMRAAIAEAASSLAGPSDVVVEIAIPGGAELATRTLNGRLGIVGGLSILGTTGIVIPFSCAAWIHSIHRGIDVARAGGLTHIAGATGTTSERAVQALYGLPEPALIEMGDFVGGLLKYIRRNPVARLTIAGGFAKMTKLGQGMLDLHSKRGEVDLFWLAARAEAAGGGADLASHIRQANTAQQALQAAQAAGLPLGRLVAEAALATAQAEVAGSGVALDVVVFDRTGHVVGKAG